jgi:hypothetical protein
MVLRQYSGERVVAGPDPAYKSRENAPCAAHGLTPRQRSRLGISRLHAELHYLAQVFSLLLRYTKRQTSKHEICTNSWYSAQRRGMNWYTVDLMAGKAFIDQRVVRSRAISS